MNAAKVQVSAPNNEVKWQLMAENNNKDKMKCDSTWSQLFHSTFSLVPQAVRPACFTNSAVKRRYSKITARVN